MKILITGTKGLAKDLEDIFPNATAISKSKGFDINKVSEWGQKFLDYNTVINCAYDGFGQLSVLEFFYGHWKNNNTKQIITIGSRVITYPRTQIESGYWSYQLHKQALQQAHDAMLIDAKCDMKIINPGPIDTEMMSQVDCIKFNTIDLALKIKAISQDTTVKRVDLWL